ncbi:MAG: hypothetical protein ABW019_18405 [Chitinophagaceae bacterium]
MTTTDACNLFISHGKQIAQARSIGTGWSAWTQVDFLLTVQSQLGMTASRKVNYPWESHRKLDMLAQGKERVYAMEMITENPSNPAPFGTRLLGEAGKIRTYSIPGSMLPLARWVIGIVYTTWGKNEIRQYALMDKNAVVQVMDGQGGIGVIVLDVLIGEHPVVPPPIPVPVPIRT